MNRLRKIHPQVRNAFIRISREFVAKGVHTRMEILIGHSTEKQGLLKYLPDELVRAIHFPDKGVE